MRLIQGIENGKRIYCSAELARVVSMAGIADAFNAIETKKCELQCAPEVANLRANNLPTTLGKSNLWHHTISTPSIRATGKTKAGSRVVVYAHVPNYLGKHETLGEIVRKDKDASLLPLPEKEFQRLVDLDGLIDDKSIRRVWVIDYGKFRNARRDVVALDEALEHPHTIPFLGGEEIARAYFIAQKEVYREFHARCARIGVSYSMELDEHTPKAKLLLLGGFGVPGLTCNGLLRGEARALGLYQKRTPRSS